MSVITDRSRGLLSKSDSGILRIGARRPGPVAPLGPSIGDLWYDTSIAALKVWSSTDWIQIGGGGVNIIGGDMTATGTITANRFKVSPDDLDDSKIDLYGGSYVIGIRSGEFYMRSGGQSFGFEAPPGSWAMRYGLEVNGTERGLTVYGNDQATERYANGWFRSKNAGTGWYNQVGQTGIYTNADNWVRIYNDGNLNTAGWVQGGSVACNGLLRVRAYTDSCHQIAYIGGSIGSPSNGTQSIDGPMLSGYNAVALGSAPCRFNNIQFRVWDNGGDYRTDTYSPLHCLQGMSVDGGAKSFLIDHPVLGSDYHLQYCAIEGPQVDLLWRGKIKLKAGKGVINIDDEVGQEEGTFEALVFNENRQFFLFNETGEATPHGAWIPGAGDLAITCVDKTATIGWMILAVRKVGLDHGHGLTEDKHLLVEWKKTDLERSTTKQQDFSDQVEETVANFEQWKVALPGSERSIDKLIVEHNEQAQRHAEGRQQHHEKMKIKREFWKGQKTKAKNRKKDKGR